MSDDSSITESSGNICKDVGFSHEEDEAELLKAQLGAEIFSILQSRNLTQTVAAKILGVKQPEISRRKRGKFSLFFCCFSLRSISAFYVKVEKADHQLSNGQTEPSCVSVYWCATMPLTL